MMSLNSQYDIACSKHIRSGHRVLHKVHDYQSRGRKVYSPLLSNETSNRRLLCVSLCVGGTFNLNSLMRNIF